MIIEIILLLDNGIVSFRNEAGLLNFKDRMPTAKMDIYQKYQPETILSLPSLPLSRYLFLTAVFCILLMTSDVRPTRQAFKKANNSC